VKLTRNLLLNATLLQALILPMLLAPSFAQQEIDPTWHDPSAVTIPATARSVQPAANENAENKRKTGPAHAASANRQQVSKHESTASNHEQKQATKEASIANSL
jgi:hypothetical protein